MKRTISGMVGKGSVTHNSRKFKAENVDGERSGLNIEYCNENIESVYLELFEQARQRYNAKQKRVDQCIDNYYEKIRSGKQEKLFHELTLQIGNREDTSAQGEHGELSKKILDQYCREFQQRNPQLRVFSAHFHMDEATPHLHVDFVPFVTGSTRGMDTRVSLKQALAKQGFKGVGKSDNEWNQWVEAEKQQLAVIMQEHGIEWEQKGTHNEHLSMLDYKKQERTKEVATLEAEVKEMKTERAGIEVQLERYGEYRQSMKRMNTELEEKCQLPDPSMLANAKTYKVKFVDPLIQALKEMLRSILAKYFAEKERVNQLRRYNQQISRDADYHEGRSKMLAKENGELKEQVKDYLLLRKVFGDEQIDNLLAKARAAQPQTITKNRRINHERTDL